MASPRFSGLPLLKAFEGALREGLLLDEALGGILNAALHFFDAPVVALLPGAGVPPMTRSGRSSVAAAAETRLNQHLADVLAQARPKKLVDGGLSFFGAPVKVKEQAQAVFGVVLETMPGTDAETEEAVREFARTIGHVLERDRTLGTLMKRREEAVALFELASGAFLSLNPDEVIRLTVASLSRELEFDRVSAFRFQADTNEITEILTHPAPTSGERSRSGQRPIAADDLLARCLAAHGPAFEDEPGTQPVRRRRMALPLHAGAHVFGFLTMSRRGGFALTPQEQRLTQELAKLAAGALEKARLLDGERRNNERIAFVGRLHGALAGLTDVGAIASRSVAELGPQFGLDLCAIRLLPSGGLPGAEAAYAKAGGVTELRIPQTLLVDLATEGTHAFYADASGDAHGMTLLPTGPAIAALPKPLGLLAVPLSYRGAPVGVLCAVSAARSKGFSLDLLPSFEALGVEVSLAIASVRLLQQERESYRFLDRLREVGRSLSTTFDIDRIKQTLCEQAVSLLKADAAQFWDADPAAKSARIVARWGADVGDDLARAVPFDQASHPVVRTFLDKTPAVAGPAEGASFFPGNSGSGAVPLIRAAAVPLTYHDELIGVLSLAARNGTDEWPVDLKERLELLADSAAVALHNARLMKLIEQQTERDSQSGLYNRSSLGKRLESEVRRAERNGQSVAVAHIRMDGLREAVVRLGAEHGDSFLPKLAAKLVRSTRAVNFVARDRDDRFFILIFEASKVQAHRAMRSIQKNFENGLDDRLAQSGVTLVLSAGISVYPDDAFDTASLLLRAEEALEEAVKAGPGSVVLYHGSEADAAAVG
ncbi:MAG: GAF domain-containing protein [Thermoanaerobaculia bacterium]|jgi:diguanylate cyclase (GGDEF)-like protein